jgi:hypothetical protein
VAPDSEIAEETTTRTPASTATSAQEPPMIPRVVSLVTPWNLFIVLPQSPWTAVRAM